MASSWIQFCLIIVFIISTKCVISGVGFPVETFQPDEELEGNQKSACIKMLTKFKSKVNELTQEMEIFIKVKEEELGSGIYRTQEITETRSRLADFTHTLEALLNHETEGYASGSIPSQKENGEGSASSCNPQFISVVELWLGSLNLRVQAVINNDMEGSGSASGNIPSQAPKTTMNSTEDPFPDQVCPNGWVHHGHSCFHIIDTPTPKWRNARSMCQRLGADLGKITTASENQFIYDLLRKQKTVTHYGVWLGLHRKKDQRFYWVDDTPLSGYTAWGPGEPNDSAAHRGEDCVHKIGEKRSWPFQPGQWNDVPCSLQGIVPSYITPVVLCQKKIAMDVISF